MIYVYLTDDGVALGQAWACCEHCEHDEHENPYHTEPCWCQDD